MRDFGPLRSQPRYSAEIDRENQFGKLVDFVWCPTTRPPSAFTREQRPFGLTGYAAADVTLGQSRVTASRPFTVLMVMCYPTASAGAGDIITMASGTGFRLYTEATGGGMYAGWTAQGVANGSVAARDATGVFDSTPIVLVSNWTPAGQTSYWDRRGYSNTTWTDTLGYSAPTDFTITMAATSVQSPYYLIAILRGNVGAAGARALQANPWQIFAPVDEWYEEVVSIGGVALSNLTLLGCS